MTTYDIPDIVLGTLLEQKYFLNLNVYLLYCIILVEFNGMTLMHPDK